MKSIGFIVIFAACLFGCAGAPDYSQCSQDDQCVAGTYCAELPAGPMYCSPDCSDNSDCIDGYCAPSGVCYKACTSNEDCMEGFLCHVPTPGASDDIGGSFCAPVPNRFGIELPINVTSVSP